MPRMPTILHERRPGRLVGDDGWESGSMRVIPHKPLYQFSSYGRCWTRILMLEDGHYLTVCLTPLNPTVESEWEALREEQIRWCQRSLFRDTAAKDKITHELPAEVVRHMHYHLGSPVAERLLTGDLWAEVSVLWPEEYERPYDITDWLGRCGYNGGIALAKVQKSPPTHAELYAAAERKRNEEREARIAAAVGLSEPLSDAERALGKSLEGHDWSHDYSDCGDTWRRARAHRDEIEKGLKALPVERARLVWKAFVHPHNEQYWKCPV